VRRCRANRWRPDSQGCVANAFARRPRGRAAFGLSTSRAPAFQKSEMASCRGVDRDEASVYRHRTLTAGRRLPARLLALERGLNAGVSKQRTSSGQDLRAVPGRPALGSSGFFRPSHRGMAWSVPFGIRINRSACCNGRFAEYGRLAVLAKTVLRGARSGCRRYNN
jgi:hypothetical protein